MFASAPLAIPEDAGPLAHPIRPDNYIEINNFYTMTVYEKGAEVIRMMRTLLGAETYRKATDCISSATDGQAATCDDFVKCMEDASGKDLSRTSSSGIRRPGTRKFPSKANMTPKHVVIRWISTQSVPPLRSG